MNESYSTTLFNSLGATGPGTNTNTFDPGYIFNFGLGYKLPLGFRIEVEGGYAHYTVATISPLSTDGTFPALNGSTLKRQSGAGRDEYTAVLNAFYDLPPMYGWIVPYIGVGGGVDSVYAQAGTFSGGGVSQFTLLSGSGTNGMAMAEVGVALTLDPKWSIVPSYRFQYVFTNNASNEAHIFRLGVRYSL